MMREAPLAVIHRTRTCKGKRGRFPKTGQAIDFNDPQFPEFERRALTELSNSPDTDFQLICARNQLSPLDMLHKWSKLLKQFKPRRLLEMIVVIKEKLKEGMSITDIGRVVGIRRTSVRNIMKGHINIEKTVEHPGKKTTFKEFEFMQAFDISLCAPKEDNNRNCRPVSIVEDFEIFRDMQVKRWMNEDGLLVPRSVQLLVLKSLAAGKSLPVTCMSFSIPETRFTRMWGELLHKYPAVALEAGSKIVSQLMLLGYTVATVSERMECNERVVRTVASNLGLDETDQESLIVYMLQEVASETNLEGLADKLNVPIAVLHSLRYRIAKAREIAPITKEKNAWWLYMNGIESGMISSWLGYPFDLVLNGKATE